MRWNEAKLVELLGLLADEELLSALEGSRPENKIRQTLGWNSAQEVCRYLKWGVDRGLVDAVVKESGTFDNPHYLWVHLLHGLTPEGERIVSGAAASRGRLVPSGQDTVRMQVFISWSGSSSHALAKILHEWLPTVLPFVDPWMSSEDIAKGQRWATDIGETLEHSSYCVVCVTPGVADQPWVNFEAGAVSKIVQQSRVSPLLLGVTTADLGDRPLVMFQCTNFEKDDVRKLLESINAASEAPVDSQTIARNLDHTWTWVSDRVNGISLSGPNRSNSTSRRLASHPDESLVGIDWDILTLAAKRYPECLYENEIAEEIDQTFVRTQHSVDRLVQLELLAAEYADDDGTFYCLSRRGRQYVVEHDLD